MKLICEKKFLKNKQKSPSKPDTLVRRYEKESFLALLPENKRRHLYFMASKILEILIHFVRHQFKMNSVRKQKLAQQCFETGYPLKQP